MLNQCARLMTIPLPCEKGCDGGGRWKGKSIFGPLNVSPFLVSQPVYDWGTRAAVLRVIRRLEGCSCACVWVVFSLASLSSVECP